MNENKIHPLTLDTPEAVDKRFDMIPKVGCTTTISSRTLQELWIAIEFLEQFVEHPPIKNMEKSKLKEAAEEILFKLPIIEV